VSSPYVMCCVSPSPFADTSMEKNKIGFPSFDTDPDVVENHNHPCEWREFSRNVLQSPYRPCFRVLFRAQNFKFTRDAPSSFILILNTLVRPYVCTSHPATNAIRTLPWTRVANVANSIGPSARS